MFWLLLFIYSWYWYIYIYMFMYFCFIMHLQQLVKEKIHVWFPDWCQGSWYIVVDMFLKGPHHENCQGHQALRRVPPITGQTLQDTNFVTVITSCLRGKYLRMLDKQCRMLTFLTGIHDFHEEQFFFNKECLLPWGMIYFMKNIFSTKKL